MKQLHRRNCVLIAVFCTLAIGGSAYGLSVLNVSPNGYQAAAFTEGAPCYADAPGTIVEIPPALAGGTLVRTRAADAGNPALSIRFDIDERTEVYVCHDPAAAVPAWLSPWVKTDMTVGVTGAATGHYRVFAKRFEAGTITLPANTASAMYFVVVQSSVPGLPRNGWILLSYDMPYMREVIKQAPDYNVNHLQLSHDIVMFTHEILKQPARRADINELIDLAHAYGVAEVTVWTHEVATHDMPTDYRTSDGKVDGDNEDLWTWIQQQYVDLFSPASGCPDVDGVVLTFDELWMFNEGVEVWDTQHFQHVNATVAQSMALTIGTVQAACRQYGKSLYARTWAGHYQDDVAEGIRMNGDKSVWIMHKNVGDPNGVDQDWQFMDSHHPTIGALSPDYNEMIEFDLGGEYLGRSRYTFTMTSYLKDHWNYALARGADGAVARIDREGSLTYYTANRLNRYALKEVLADPAADPAAINLAWCRQHFPAEAAQDIADHYDAPETTLGGDTRYMTWESFYPWLSPISNAEARNIGYAAIERIDRHRTRLETQAVLDTRDGKNDYETLRYGIALPILDLGGTVPEVYGYSSFQPSGPASLVPDCTIQLRIPAPGLRPASATCRYSTDEGVTWHPWPVLCSGNDGSVKTETIVAIGLPFTTPQESQNLIRFQADDVAGQPWESEALTVVTQPGPTWGDFQPAATRTTAPDCKVTVAAADRQLEAQSARYSYSVDGGLTWIAPQTPWTGRYDCDAHPTQAGWSVAEGKAGYATALDGILTISDPGIDAGDKIKFARNWNPDPQVGATAVARMRCPSGGHFFGTNLSMADPLHSESLYLKANGMIGLQGYGSLVPLNTSDWHIYRMTIKGEDIYVYVDENPRPAIGGRGAFIHGEAGARLMIGSGASQYRQEIQYDYVCWTTAGAFAPTVWHPAQFDGDGRSATLTAGGVAFLGGFPALNRIRFSIDDTEGRTWYSPTYTVRLLEVVWADFDGDDDVDQADFGRFQACVSGDGKPFGIGCEAADVDADHDVDRHDFAVFQSCLAGANQSPGC